MTLLFLTSVSLLIQPSLSVGLSPFPPVCPVSCSSALEHGGLWSHFQDLDYLSACKDTVVFHTSLSNKLNDPSTQLTLRACSMSSPPAAEGSKSVSARHDEVSAPAVDAMKGCKSGAQVQRNTVSVGATVNHGPGTREGAASRISDASVGLYTALGQQLNCETTSLFAKSEDVVMGMYVGAAIEKSSALNLLDQFTRSFQSETVGSQMSLQLCGNRRPSRLSTGIFVDTTGNVSAVHEAVRRWSRAECITDFEEEDTMEVELGFLPILSIPLVGAKARHSNIRPGSEERNIARSLRARAECEAVQVATGDSCWSLSDSCGISEEDFRRYNPVKDLCVDPAAIQEGQYYCCSEGTLPDFSPQPDAAGNCVTHTITSELCFELANIYKTTADKLEEVNKNTWGWMGCNHLQENQIICVGPGNPPMPIPLENAQCGPLVPGSERPTDDTELVDMNPCPLKACCNVWGSCGTTGDYCIPSPADTGAPGAAKPNTNGCISNCGMDIVNNDKGPDQFISLAYFEAWNLERPCAHLDVTEIPNHYTHIHFSFLDLTPDFKVDTSNVQQQFDRFLELDGSAKRIISFGGWAFSTDQDTYKIFRLGVQPGNAEVLASNIVEFVVANNLDGVDFDWEYPGAPDLPVDDPDNVDNGDHYLNFLKLVRDQLPSDKSVSIAAPASFWYLKAYPIAGIADIVNYIVYMTYDLHGQWDYGTWWSSPGCSPIEEGLGNCLRSHVNWTETENALSMITKAGVPSNKILVGISSYGRSFKMAEQGCTGPMCRFVGVGSKYESAALPGECTETAGYLSEFEIREIIGMYAYGGEEDEDSPIPEGSFKTWYDEDSQSDILVYDNTEWVAWMDDDTKTARINKYKELNFAGVIDWAVDLAGGRDYQNLPDEEELAEIVCPDRSFSDLQDLEQNGGDLPAPCAAEQAMEILTKMLDDAVSKFHNLDNEKYDKRFKQYIEAVKAISTANIGECMSWNGNGPCNKYFDCTFQDSGGQSSGSCPMTEYDPFSDASFTIVYDLQDKEGLFKTLAEDFGVSGDWITFEDQIQEDRCVGRAPPPGANPRPVDQGAPVERRQCMEYKRVFKGFPTIKDDSKIPNPKEAIQASLENIDELYSEITLASIDIALGIWEGSDSELVEAVSLPILMIVQSVNSMEQIHKIGEEIEDKENEQKRKNLILTIIMAAIIVIPIAGEAALALGWTTLAIARIAIMIGVAGEVALSVVDMVDDPSSVLMSAMLLLIPGLPGSIKRTDSAVKDLVKKKRDYGDHLHRIGEVFKKHDTSIQNIANKVCRR